MTDSIPVAPHFRSQAVALHDGFDNLLDRLASGHVYRSGERPAPPVAPGVYLFAEGPTVVHVGRTRNLQSRRRDHTAPSNDRWSATAAFRLAVAAATAVHPDLPKTREELELDERFGPYFVDAKARFRDLDFRCVEIEHPPRQAAFEIFASIALGLPLELWRTH